MSGCGSSGSQRLMVAAIAQALGVGASLWAGWLSVSPHARTSVLRRLALSSRPLAMA